MRLFTFALLATVPTAIFSSPTPGILDAPKKFYNERIVPFILKKMNPLLEKNMEDSFDESVKLTVGILPEAINSTIDEALAQPWGGHSMIIQHLLHPLQERVKEVKHEAVQNASLFFDEVAKQGRTVALSGVQQALQRFFSIGKEFPFKPIAVNLTAPWLLKPAQKKAEQLHAEIMFTLKPLMTKFILDKQPMINEFALHLIKESVIIIVNKGRPKQGFTGKIIDLAITSIHKFFVKKVESGNDKVIAQLLLSTNRMLRKELYEMFLLTKYAEDVNNSVKVA